MNLQDLEANIYCVLLRKVNLDYLELDGGSDEVATAKRLAQLLWKTWKRQ